MLKQKFVLSYFSKAFIELLQITASVVVARIAGPGVLGTVAFGMAYAGMFKFLSTLGLNHIHIKLISEGHDEGNCISTFARLKFFTTSLFLLTVISFFVVQKYFFNAQFESVEHQIVIGIFVLTAVIHSIGDIPVNTFAAKIEQAKQDIPNIFKNILLHSSRVVVVIVGFGAVALALVNFFSFFVLLLISLFLFRKYPRGHYDKFLAKKFLLMGVPMIVLLFSSGLIHTIDKVLLQFYSNSVEVGVYAASFKFGNVVKIIGSSIGLLFFPMISKLLTENNYEYVSRIINKYLRFCYLFIMPTVIIIAICSGYIVDLVLGSEYEKTKLILSLVTLAVFFELVNLPYANLLLSSGLFKLAAIINVVTLCGFVFFLILFVHPALFEYGGLGAGIAFLINKIIISLLYYYYARKRITNIQYRLYTGLIVFGITSLALFYFIYQYLIDDSSLLQVIAFVSLFYAITYAFLFLVKWMNKGDVSELIGLFNAKKIKSYVKNEFSD